ncbi:hypothetical protein [Glycocaulis sp.]
MLTPLLLASATTLGAAALMDTLPDGWWTLRSVRQGALIVHFVMIEGPSARQPGVYEDAATRLCRNESHCQVHFWDDPDRAAAGLPLTDDQLDARTGLFIRNTHTGFEQLELACLIRHDPERC